MENEVFLKWTDCSGDPYCTSFIRSIIWSASKDFIQYLWISKIRTMDIRECLWTSLIRILNDHGYWKNDFSKFQYSEGSWYRKMSIRYQKSDIGIEYELWISRNVIMDIPQHLWISISLLTEVLSDSFRVAGPWTIDCLHLRCCVGCCGGGPGYKSPQDAMQNGPKEKLIYVTCVHRNTPNKDKPDFLATVDVDPTSPTYSQVSIIVHITRDVAWGHE